MAAWFRCAFAVCWLLSPALLWAEDEPAVKFRLPREGDTATLKAPEVIEGVEVHDASATLLIHSSRGIGEIEIERVGPAWPSTLTLHIDISALEGLRLTTPRGTWETGLGREQPEATQHSPPLGAPIRTAKIGERLIQVELPVTALGDAERLHVLWIDYYRR